MTCIHSQIIRRQRLVTEKMKHIKRLPQLDKILVIFKIARPPPFDSAMHIRRPGHHAEMNMIAANYHRPVSIGRRQHKFRRGGGQQFSYQLFRQPHNLASFVHLSPGLFIELARPRAVHLNTCLFQHRH